MQPDVDKNELDDEVVDQIQVDDDDADEEDEDIGGQTIVMSEDDFEDDAGISMEVNVEKLVAELDKSNLTDIQRRSEIRRRLEELVDDGAFEDTYAMEFDS